MINRINLRLLLKNANLTKIAAKEFKFQEQDQAYEV
jgi:hypothetical protein